MKKISLKQKKFNNRKMKRANKKLENHTTIEEIDNKDIINPEPNHQESENNTKNGITDDEFFDDFFADE